LLVEAAAVSTLLLLTARDLLLHDPLRVLAWRLLHDERLAAIPGWLQALLPQPSAELDRDPIALVLGALAVLLAIIHLCACLGGASARVRLGIVGAASVVLVVLPTLAFVVFGNFSGRPYGQDGGVVQLPLALDKLLAGESPYGADYSDSMLGKQARVSGFWEGYAGGNPILHHHAYLPGTHLVMMPFHLAARAAGVPFDPRLVTLIAYVAAAWLAVRLVAPHWGPLAAAVVLVNPLVYWHQIFGANDLLVGALLLLALLLADRERPLAAALVLGFACATKQLAWPFAPFLLVRLSGARSFAELVTPVTLRRLAVPLCAAAAVFLAVVAPVAALDFRRFWGDIVVYNVGLPGGDNYPLGGTPGFGFANFLVVAGRVSSLQDYVPFGRFYVLLVPLGLLLVRHLLHEARSATVLVAGSAALLASLYLSRVVHPNYLILAAVMLPLGFLMGERRPADVAVVPLLLLGAAVELAQHEVMRAVWADAVAVALPTHARGWLAAFVPRAAPLTADPWGLWWSAAAAGLAVSWLIAGVLGAGRRARLSAAALAAVLLVAVPALLVARVGVVSGQPRGQHGWMTAVSPSAREIVEAWSPSFRRDPPHPLAADEGEALRPAGTGALRKLLALAGGLDPRVLSLLALLVVGLLIGRMAPVDAGPLALATVWLAPPLVLGLPMGSGDVVLLALVLTVLALGAAARPIAAAAALGVALAFFPRLLPAVPFLALVRRPVVARSARTGVVTLFVWGALAVVSSISFGALGIWSGSLRPGLGLTNLILYRADGSPQAWLPLLAFATLAIAALLLARRFRFSPRQALAASAAALLGALWVLPGASTHDLTTPLALALLAALGEPRPDPGEARMASVELSTA
jgi:hypothetical protein